MAAGCSLRRRRGWPRAWSHPGDGRRPGGEGARDQTGRSYREAPDDGETPTALPDGRPTPLGPGWARASARPQGVQRLPARSPEKAIRPGCAQLHHRMLDRQSAIRDEFVPHRRRAPWRRAADASTGPALLPRTARQGRRLRGRALCTTTRPRAPPPRRQPWGKVGRTGRGSAARGLVAQAVPSPWTRGCALHPGASARGPAPRCASRRCTRRARARRRHTGAGAWPAGDRGRDLRPSAGRRGPSFRTARRPLPPPAARNSGARASGRVSEHAIALARPCPFLPGPGAATRCVRCACARACVRARVRRRRPAYVVRECGVGACWCVRSPVGCARTQRGRAAWPCGRVRSPRAAVCVDAAWACVRSVGARACGVVAGPRGRRVGARTRCRVKAE